MTVTSIQASKAAGRLEFLDAARGIAAFAVVVQHSLELSVPGFLPWSVHHLNFGAFGVVMFFIISGFIIPASIERSQRLQDFWANRFFRLYPMYWVSLIAALLLAFFKLCPLPKALLVHPIAGILINFTMMQTFLGVPDALGVYWTLALELVFYLLTSLLFVWGWHRRSLFWAWGVTGAFAFCVLLAGVAFHRSLPAGRLGLLVTAFAGAAIFRAYSNKQNIIGLFAMLAATSATLLVGFWFRFHLYPSHGEGGWDIMGVSASWALAYAGFAILILLSKHQFPRLLVWVGKISYSLYLVHGVVLALLPGNWNPVIFLIASIGLSILIAAATYQFVEKPAIAFHQNRVRSRHIREVPAVTS